MKKITLSICAFFLMIGISAQNTMTFDSDCSEEGFSFSNWNYDSGKIFSGNLRNPSFITDNEGTFTITSFEVTGFLSNNTIEVTSDLGDSYTYSTNTAQTHTLNWAGVTTITFNRIAGTGQASDHDNFVYTPSETLTTREVSNTNLIEVFPNPVRNRLNISNAKENMSFTIYDIAGRRITSGNLNLNSINIEGLTTGNYVLELNDGLKRQVARFAKL